MAMAAAAATRRLTGGLLGAGNSKMMFSLTWVRRMADQHEKAKVPTEDEVRAFVTQFNVFLKRCQGSIPEESFSELMKNLSFSMSSIAHKDGVLYPSELANLVATFVPIQGTYVPYNSKIVVDMVRRIDALEDGKRMQNALISGVTTAFLGTMFYLPFSLFKAENSNHNLDKRVSVLEASYSADDTRTKEGSPEDKASSAKGEKATLTKEGSPEDKASSAKGEKATLTKEGSPEDKAPSAEGEKATSAPAKDAPWMEKIASAFSAESDSLTIMGAVGGCAIAVGTIIFCILKK